MQYLSIDDTTQYLNSMKPVKSRVKMKFKFVSDLCAVHSRKINSK